MPGAGPPMKRAGSRAGFRSDAPCGVLAGVLTDAASLLRFGTLRNEYHGTVSAVQNVRMSRLAFATAAVTLVASIFLLLTYLFEVPTNGPYYYGTVNDLFTALGGLMVAVLILGISRGAENSTGSLFLVRAAVAATLIGAIGALLLLVNLLPFVVSTIISMAVLLLQGIWMIWVNSRLYAKGEFPRLLARCGQIVGWGLLVGLTLVAISLLLPWLTIPQLLVLGVGVFIGGGVWLAWPLWFVLLSLHLRRGPDAPRRRGRRALGA